jgi:uncharacterized phiE125 gp8 family phage protein
VAAQDLTTLQNVKDWCGLGSTTTDDAIVRRLITAASVQIASYLNQNIVSQSYVETRNGNGATKLLLRQGPITAVASLSIDGIAIPARPAVNQVGFYFGSDFLHVDGYTFTWPGRNGPAQNVVVNYTAGYAAGAIPPDLEQACIELASTRFKSRERIAIKSKMLGAETISYDLTAIPAAIQAMLQQYVRVVV